MFWHKFSLPTPSPIGSKLSQNKYAAVFEAKSIQKHIAPPLQVYFFFEVRGATTKQFPYIR